MVAAAMHGTAVVAGAADSRLADLAQRLVVTQRVFERSELGVRLGGAAQLRVDDVRSLAPEPVQLEQEPAQVAELDLTQLA